MVYAHAEHGGRHHRFDDAEKWAARFENPERDAWQKPEQVIAGLDLAADAKVADIGSATGYFPIRIAKMVPQGKVWGVDIEPDMVRHLNARAAKEGLDNLVSVLGEPDDPRLPEPVDRILVVNTYHHIADRSAYFSRLRKHLTAAARIAIVDFKMGELPVGPPEAMKLAPDAVEREMAAAGYRLLERIDLPYQYMLVFE